MSGVRDYLLTSLSDSLLPLLRRSLEDVVYEILDHRGVPSRTDFRELADTVSKLRQEASSLQLRLQAQEAEIARLSIRPSRTRAT